MRPLYFADSAAYGLRSLLSLRPAQPSCLGVRCVASELRFGFDRAKSKRRANGEAPIQRAESIDEAVSMYRALQFVGDTTLADLDRERVAQRAYELYLARGGVDGQAMEDWLNAERELIRGA